MAKSRNGCKPRPGTVWRHRATGPIARAMRKLFLFLVAMMLGASPALAELLVDNVNGYTLRQDGRLIQFNGMRVGEDGRVKQLYSGRERRPERPRYRLDGRGRTLIPGLIDAHGHIMGLGFNAILLDLSDTNSLQEAQRRIAEYAAANPTPRWIVGRGWNQEKWGLGRFPTAADLDSVVADRPVWLTRVDGHAGWANTMAMREAGITAQTQSPAGGRRERTGRNPSGILLDAAMPLIERSLPPPVPRQRDQALAAAQRLMLSNGLTAVADVGTGMEDWNVMRRAGDEGRLNVRILSYASGIDNLLAIAGR